MQPLGLKNVSMFPTSDMKAKLSHMNFRNPDGKLSEYDHLQRRPLIVETEHQVKSCFNSGGAGCFAKPSEYAREFWSVSKLNRALLNVVDRNSCNPAQ